MRKTMIILIIFIGIVFGFAIQSQAETILFHIKTALDKDDAQICVAPNIALAAQENGDNVVLLFDASAVTSLTKGWGFWNFGNKTPMDKAGLPVRERKSLSGQFGIPLNEIPHNYGDYLKFLKKRGAKIFVNRTMLSLYQIDPSRVDSVTESVELNTMLKIFDSADKTLVY